MTGEAHGKENGTLCCLLIVVRNNGFKVLGLGFYGKPQTANRKLSIGGPSDQCPRRGKGGAQHQRGCISTSVARFYGFKFAPLGRTGAKRLRGLWSSGERLLRELRGLR